MAETGFARARRTKGREGQRETKRERERRDDDHHHAMPCHVWWFIDGVGPVSK